MKIIAYLFLDCLTPSEKPAAMEKLQPPNKLQRFFQEEAELVPQSNATSACPLKEASFIRNPVLICYCSWWIKPPQPLQHPTVCDFICKTGWCNHIEWCSSYEAVCHWCIRGWAMKINYKANRLAISCQRLCLVTCSCSFFLWGMLGCVYLV